MNSDVKYLWLLPKKKASYLTQQHLRKTNMTQKLFKKAYKMQNKIVVTKSKKSWQIKDTEVTESKTKKFLSLVKVEK